MPYHRIQGWGWAEMASGYGAHHHNRRHPRSCEYWVEVPAFVDRRAHELSEVFGVSLTIAETSCAGEAPPATRFRDPQVCGSGERYIVARLDRGSAF